jgi:Icc-related predicted phosphoesterase
MSDLHLEFHRDKGKAFIESLDSTNVDVLVLAGDVTVGELITDALDRFSEKFQNSQILYVHGNHEYYNSSPREVEVATTMAMAEWGHVHWLNNSVKEIENIRFIGTTLWVTKTPDAIRYKRWLNDFAIIENADPWIFDENEKAKKFLEDEVKKGDVIITHHIPSPKSIHQKFAGQPTNCYFLCNMEGLILERCPALWIHGHTHCSFDYQIEYAGTRVVCNPFGYKDFEENKEFEENKIVEILPL